MHIAIIGAGPAGITAAYELAKGGCRVDLYEANSYVGGMAATIELWGQLVDLGPHRFFSNDTRVNQLWLEVVGGDYEMINRQTRILYNNKFYDYPLKPFNAFFNLGPVESFLCLLSYSRQLFSGAKSSDPASFEEWVISRFGTRLYNLFFKVYSEKLWGIPCTELDADFAAQRIKKFSLSEAVKSAFGIGAAKHKTLVDQFAYPHAGTGMVYERMARKIEETGSEVFLNTPVKRVIRRGDQAIGLELASGETKSYDHIISSMPITDLVQGLGELPAQVSDSLGKLRFRNTILVFLKVDKNDLFSDNWIYVHSADLAMGRITNYRNWIPQLNRECEESILVLEYWCYDDDAIWSASDGEIGAKAAVELDKSGLARKAQVLDHHIIRLHRSYPVYARGYKEHLQPVAEELKKIENLTLVGRYGTFKYNNQDHSMLMGHLAAQNILHAAGHDLWEVNSDDEYQESSIITSTGLQKAF